MPITYYQIRHPSGEYVQGVDYRPAKYRSIKAAEQRARLMSAIYGRTIEIEKFPKPFVERRFIYVQQ